MPSKRIQLFATRADLELGIRAIEAKSPLKYALCGLFPSPEARYWRSLLDVKGLGIATKGDQSLCERYLVFRSHCSLEIRSVPQQSGGTLYAVDQLWNPTSIVVQPGGLFGREFIIVGNIGTASTNADSINLYQEFSRTVTRDFRKMDNLYFVGPEALELYKRGVRLITMHTQQTQEYDVKPI